MVVRLTECREKARVGRVVGHKAGLWRKTKHS